MKTPNILSACAASENNAVADVAVEVINGSANGKGLETNCMETTKKSILGVRHLQCLLIFCGISVAYALRVNISLAVVAMTDNSSNENFVEYHWDEKTRSLLHSSFFWGYVITQVPGGQIARKFGGKVILFYGMLVCSILSALTPQCAAIGDWKLVCALRVLQGLCQGIIFPSTHTILSKWAPVEERGALGTYCYAGAQFGTVVMLSSSGFIAASPTLGWPSIFYISGAVGVLWSVIWFFLGASTPADYKKISPEERKFIETSLGEHSANEASKKQLKTPWFKIFTSPPFLVLILVHCTHNWGFWTLLTEIPTYMKNVLGMDIKRNALLSALPYLVMCILSFVFSFLANALAKSQRISLVANRKIFNSIGHWIPMITLICLGYLGSDHVNWAIFLLTATVGINSATYLGFQVNHIDLSPNFAGILMGITNCCANIMSILAPLLVGLIVVDEKNPDQWRIVFFIAAAFLFTGNFMFVVFGQAKIQPWNDNGSINPSAMAVNNNSNDIKKNTNITQMESQN